MIRKFEIDNFKSLVDFSLPMPPNALGRFVCLIGLNGAGKSTVLQALDFGLNLGRVDPPLVHPWRFVGQDEDFGAGNARGRSHAAHDQFPAAVL